MKFRFILLSISFVTLFFPTAKGYYQSEKKGTESLNVGVAVIDITPLQRLNVELSGYRAQRFGQRLSKGVHDPITCRCFVIDDSNTEIIIIALDHSNLPYHALKNRMVPIIHSSTGIPEEHIFFHSTHTHSGPSIAFYVKNPEEYETMERKIIQCSQKAKTAKMPAIAKIASGQANVGTVNRQFPNRDVINELNVIEFQDLEKATIATLVNFACHPVVLGPDNTLMSSDYIHYVREEMEEHRKGVSIFISGALGDINPEPVKSNSNYRSLWDRKGGTYLMAQTLGKNIAQNANSLLKTAQTNPVSIRLISNEISLKGDIKTKVSIIDFQSFVIVTIPGEPTSSFKRMLKPLFPNIEQLYFGLTHDRFGYIMPREDWMGIPLGVPLPDSGKGKYKNWAEDLFIEYRDLSTRLWTNADN